MNATPPLGSAGPARDKLSPAEAKLLAAANAGQDYSSPQKADVGADLIRALLTGEVPGCDPCRKPLRVSNLRFTGELDLSDQKMIRPFFAKKCEFEGLVKCYRSELSYLELEGCTFGAKGQSGERIAIEQSQLPLGISLMGSSIYGEVRISFATVGGNARFSGTKIYNGLQSPDTRAVFNRGCYALNCEGSCFAGDVIFDHGFEAHGEVWLVGIVIKGDLYCHGSFLNPPADSQGTLRNALSLARSRIDGGFDFRDIEAVAGVVSLGSLRAAVLLDHHDSWAKVEALAMNGFCFGSLGGKSPTSWKMRSAWLGKQVSFARQPWMHTISVLRAAGHVHDADCLGQAYELQLRREKFGNRFFLRFWHKVYGLLTAYGYRPQRALYELLGLWIISALIFELAAHYGVFAPADPHIFLDEAFESCRGAGSQWVGCAALAKEYPEFSGTMYALDLILPVIDLHLEREWMPMSTTPLGWLVRALAWLDILLGWVGSVAMVAALTKLVNRS